MTSSALQRINMVESQIRPSDITDRRILRAMLALPRENFVAPSFVKFAYMDEAVPLSDPPVRSPLPPRTMMAPRTLAKLIQLAQIEDTSHVLDVGAGRGYGAALLGQMAATVRALESDTALAAAATSALAPYANVSVHTGPLASGLPDHGPFDVIFLEGAVSASPDTLLSQLKPGGRLVGVIQAGQVGQATIWRRVGDTAGSTSAFEATAGPLPGFERPAAFVF